MRSVCLVAVTDEYDSTPGLAVKGVPQVEGFMADRTGLLVAHDLLEHQNGIEHIGRVWDELEALGAIWQVRGRHGDLMTPSVHSPQENAASDLSRMFGDYPADGWPPPKHQYRSTRPCDYDEDFHDIIDRARLHILQECREEDLPTLDRYLKEALDRMRIGLRKAYRRFGGGYEGIGLFRSIRDAVALGVRCVEFEGQEFRLTYGDGEARIKEIVDLEDLR